MKKLLKKLSLLVLLVRHIRVLRATISDRIEIHHEVRQIAFEYKKYDLLILKDRRAGLFSIYFQAIAAYEVARINKQKIVFDFSSGPYFMNSRMESSWWDYYFDMTNSIHYSNNLSIESYCVIGTISEQHKLAWLGAKLARNIGFDLRREFQLKDFIKKEVELFVEQHFKDSFVVGIHYRGTDKVEGEYKESCRVDYLAILSILESLNGLGIDFTIFVATDEVKFLKFLDSRNFVPCYTQSFRTTDGGSIHLENHSISPYRKGLEAVVDCYLLSRCDFLLRTDSNLSKACDFLNPKLQTINVSSLCRKASSDGGNISSSDLTAIGQKVEQTYRERIPLSMKQ